MMVYTFFIKGREVPLYEDWDYLALAEHRAQDLARQYGRTVTVYNALSLQIYKIAVAA